MFSKNKVVIILILCLINVIKGDVFEECEDIEPDTYVAKSDSCSAYILCNEDDSELLECDEGEYFDSETGECDAKENVVCPLDEEEEEEEEETEEPEPLTTVATTLPTTTLPSIILETTPAEILAIPQLVKDNCPASDDPNQIVFIISNTSCSDYFVCYHGHPIEMHCTNHLHFNSLTGKCDFPENSNCKIKTQPPSPTNRCLPHVTDFFPHPQKCNYFYYCIKGYQTLQQCPFFYGWDIERRTCVHMTKAKCYDNTH